MNVALDFEQNSVYAGLLLVLAIFFLNHSDTILARIRVGIVRIIEGMTTLLMYHVK